ncbi:hypothetical protein CCP3SC1AL1_1380004 [Gammaproteobacteria bacterium]
MKKQKISLSINNLKYFYRLNGNITMNKFMLIIIVILTCLSYIMFLYWIYKLISLFYNPEPAPLINIFVYDGDMMSNRNKYTEACIDSIYKKLSINFNIIVVNDFNLSSYIDDKELEKVFNLEISSRLKLFIIKCLLLRNHGGIYIDSNVFVFKDIYNLVEEAYKNSDFIGSGSSNNRFTPHMISGYTTPSIKMMGSKKNGLLVCRIINNIHNNLSLQPEDILQNTINECISMYSYVYYHILTMYDGTIDKYGERVIQSEYLEKSYDIFINNPYYILLEDTDVLESSIDLDFLYNTIEEEHVLFHKLL